ncbi:MAG TPA: hypothetical protein PLT28_05770 [Saprospiraceae bacterium]|nr:hypothetical protein [Saprospiraceae bacterium]
MIRSEVIRGKGKLHYISDISREKGYKDARDFLYYLVIHYIHVASKLIENQSELFDPAFAYREKQAHTILSPALFQFCQSFLGECPVDREHNRSTGGEFDDSYGYIDYVCRYNDKAFAMEVKQVTIKSSISKRLKGLWKALDVQLKNTYMYKDYLKDSSKGLYTVKLLISPIWRASNWKERVILYDGGELKDFICSLFIELKMPPNYVAVWEFGEKQRLIYGEDGYYYGYSGIAFSAKISKMRYNG